MTPEQAANALFSILSLGVLWCLGVDVLFDCILRKLDEREAARKPKGRG